MTPSQEADPRSLARLCDILTSVAGPDRTPPVVAPETPLGEGGFWLDSADLLEVVLTCEEAFSVEIDLDSALPASPPPTVAILLAAVEHARRA